MSGIALTRQGAWHLLEREAGGREAPVELVDAAERLCGKLHGQLATLVGPKGSLAVLRRAARSRGPADLAATAIELGDGNRIHMVGLREEAQRRDPEQVKQSLAALLVGLVDLLSGLLGEDITRRVIRLSWPDASLGQDGQGSREGSDE